MNRREFIGAMGAAAGALALPGCLCPPPCRPNIRLAFYLGSIRDYIIGKTDADGNAVAPGVGLAKTFRALAAMGYEGVELDDNYLNDAKTLKAMLADSGLVVCGRQVAKSMLAPEKIAETCEFEINYGNNLLVCADVADADVAFVNTAATTAAKYGCRLAVRGDAATLQRFLANANPLVCAELDVAVSEDPCAFCEALPHRTQTLLVRAKGGTDWAALAPAAAKDGVRWYVATSEPCGDLSAALAASQFFRSKLLG